jgi:hypothetical protein
LDVTTNLSQRWRSWRNGRSALAAAVLAVYTQSGGEGQAVIPEEEAVKVMQRDIQTF